MNQSPGSSQKNPTRQQRQRHVLVQIVWGLDWIEKISFWNPDCGFSRHFVSFQGQANDYDFISETYETMEVYTAGFIILFSGKKSGVQFKYSI